MQLIPAFLDLTKYAVSDENIQRSFPRISSTIFFKLAKLLNFFDGNLRKLFFCFGVAEVFFENSTFSLPVMLVICYKCYNLLVLYY